MTSFIKLAHLVAAPAALKKVQNYPVTGNPDWDATWLKRIDANTVEFTRKKAGKVISTATIVVSKDGKTLTLTAKGVNAKGEKFSNTGVFEKQ